VIRVLFVCMGNICRSPTAQGVFEKLVAEAGLAHAIVADSAGTIDEHAGEAPDRRTQRAALARGIDIAHLRARKARPEDFLDFDIIVAMDKGNLRTLAHMTGTRGREKLRLFLEFAPHLGESVPDPYYGGMEGFERVLDLCEAAARGLLAHLIDGHGLKP
jgi:protein-tyrosine phosphatase